MKGFDPYKFLAENAASKPMPEGFSDPAAEKPAQIAPASAAPLPSGHKADAERAAIIEHDGKTQQEWADGYARLLAIDVPSNVTAERWQLFLNDCGKFLDTWIENASALGWASGDLFGLADDYSFAGRDLAMLAWILEGRDLVALTIDDAVIRENDGAVRKYRRDRAAAPGRIAWGLIA